MSSDGTTFSYVNRSSNIVPGDTNDMEDLFVYNRITGQTTMITAPSGLLVQYVTSSALSANGRYIAFDCVPKNDDGFWGDLSSSYVMDLYTGALECVSVSNNGELNNEESYVFPRCISGDGRTVTFTSTATNLVTDTRNGDLDSDIYARIRW
jgi:hypothetical protein